MSRFIGAIERPPSVRSGASGFAVRRIISMRTAIAFAAAGVLVIQSLGAEQPSLPAASSALRIVSVPQRIARRNHPCRRPPAVDVSAIRTTVPSHLLHGGGQDHMVFTTRPWFANSLVQIIIVTPSVGEAGTLTASQIRRQSMRISCKTWWCTWTSITALWRYGKGARSPASHGRMGRTPGARSRDTGGCNPLSRAPLIWLREPRPICDRQPQVC